MGLGMIGARCGILAIDIGADGRAVMEIDTERIDEAVLALLLLGLHDGRVWKSFDWDAMDRLHRKGLISDPVGKAKSVVLTEEGQREARSIAKISSMYRTASIASGAFLRSASSKNLRRPWLQQDASMIGAGRRFAS